MSEISIWPPLNQKDLWLPGVFYTGNKLRLGALQTPGSQKAINQFPNSTMVKTKELSKDVRDNIADPAA